jgi:signal peptidase I
VRAGRNLRPCVLLTAELCLRTAPRRRLDRPPCATYCYHPDQVKTLLKIVLFVVVVVGMTIGIMRATCIDFWRIPGDDPFFSTSLIPNLAPGDLIVVWTRGAPGFADLVRCSHPEDPAKNVVGRLFGEAADNIDIDGTQVVLNGKGIGSAHACPKNHLQSVDPQTNDPVELLCETEEAGSNEYQRVRAAAPLYKPQAVKMDVPAGHVFLVSDNRYNHFDSRDYGSVAQATCQKLVFRLWSAEGWWDSEHRMTVLH